MAYKILVFTPAYENSLEEGLQEFLQEGGEVFFVHSLEAAETLLKQEEPHLSFVDEDFHDYLAKKITGKVIWLTKEVKKEEGFLAKPLRARDVLRICREVFPQPSSNLPPLSM